MEQMQLKCRYCGARNFASASGLSSHVKSHIKNGVHSRVSSFRKPQGLANQVPFQSKNVPFHEQVQQESIETISEYSDHVEVDLEVLVYEQSKASQSQKDTFDSTFSLVNFIRTCRNKEGLSQKDINALLELLHDPRFEISKVCVKNFQDVDRYEEKSYKPEDVSVISDLKSIKYVLLIACI